MFMKYHWYAKFPIKKQQTVDIHFIKDEIVIFNDINFKKHHVFWNLLLRLHLRIGIHLG